jgi:hypothetical protein
MVCEGILMTISDRTKAQILAALLTIAGFTWFFVSSAGDTGNIGRKSRPKSNITRQLKDPTIQIALIEKSGLYRGGQKDIFRYRQLPLRQSTETVRTEPVLKPRETTTTFIDERPLSPQRDPSKTFKYEGFSIKGAPEDGRIMASLSADGNTYTATLGECLVGQYCVRQLTENMIEIEDLQLKQRRTFPRTSQ